MGYSFELYKLRSSTKLVEKRASLTFCKLKKEKIKLSLLTPSMQLCAAVRATIGDKIVETLYSSRVTSENKRIITPLPPPLHLKLGCLLFYIGSPKSGTTLHGGDGGEKVYFSLFKSVRRQKVALAL